MAPYCTPADMLATYPRDRLQELTDDARAGAPDEALIERALLDAQGVVDAYVGRLYRVPLETAPTVIKRLVLGIAFVGLLQRRNAVPEEWEKQDKAARELLRDIAAGKVSLGVEPLPAQGTMALGAEVDGAERVFSRASLADVL